MKRKIDNLGRLVIPSEMRKELKLENGSSVNIELVEGEIIINNPIRKDNIEAAIKYIESIDTEFICLGVKEDILKLLKGE